MIRQLLTLVLSILLALPLSATTDSTRTSNLKLSLTILDFPYLTSTDQWFPSMQQSLEISKSFYHLGDYGIESLSRKLVKSDSREVRFKRGFMNLMLDVPLTLLSIYVPGGYAWMHEEYHAVVGRIRGIDSYNEVNSFPFFKDFIAVTRVQDEDLIRMKSRYNPDMVRMSSAGIEGQTDLSWGLQQDQFFYNTRPKMLIYWLAAFHSYRYISSAAKNDVVSDEDYRLNENELERDLVGWDPNAWVYDLFRPDESYHDRGVHPSGVGVDRYIQSNQLTEEEADYLDKQASLSVISFVDPFLFGISKIRISNIHGQPLFANMNLKHYMTSFGHTINANVMFRHNGLKGVLTFLNQRNYRNYFPGVSFSLIDLPVTLGRESILISPRLIMWSQPEDQNFRTDSGQWGGLLGLSAVRSLSKNLFASVTVEGKTAGWVASNPFLDKNVSMRFGLRYFAAIAP